MTCSGNILVLRTILLILKLLMMLSKDDIIVRCLESVLGPAVVNTFRNRFCKIVASEGFGNPVYKCGSVPPSSVMPGLSLRADLNFRFNFVDLHGETYDDFLNRIDAEVSTRES